jgi:5-methylcytosine-specific restriction endonuclease McrA
MKQCSQCKTEYPATLEYFYKCKKGKDGLYSKCKKCKLEDTKQHNSKQETKEKRAIYGKEYREKNKEKTAAYLKMWRKKNKEKIVNDHKLYYEQNKENILAYHEQYRNKNKEHILKRDKQYRKENKENLSLKEKIYRQTDKGKNIRYYHNLKIRSLKYNREFSPIERTEILKRDNWTCQICEIKVHDESTGDWNTDDKAHIDHIIPLSKGGNSEVNNLQILCKKCNLVKGEKIALEVKTWEGLQNKQKKI